MCIFSKNFRENKYFCENIFENLLNLMSSKYFHKNVLFVSNFADKFCPFSKNLREKSTLLMCFTKGRDFYRADFCFQIGLFHDSEKGIQYAVLISLMCAYFRFHRWALLCFHRRAVFRFRRWKFLCFHRRAVLQFHRWAFLWFHEKGQFFAFIDGHFFAFIGGQFFGFSQGISDMAFLFYMKAQISLYL
jgi:hypothetical protein